MSAIIDFFQTIVDFLKNLVCSVIWIMQAIPKFQQSISAVLAYCPTFLLVFVEISLALMVLFAVFKLL